MSSETIPEYSEKVKTISSSLASEVILVKLKKIIDQLDIHFAEAKNLIVELARKLDEAKRCKQSQICRKIKELLEDKIKGGKISEKWIEECLPREYKRRYTKSELSSLSKQAKKDNTTITGQIKLTIPREKFENVKAVMEKTRDFIYLIFDKSCILERVESDVLTETTK